MLPRLPWNTGQGAQNIHPLLDVPGADSTLFTGLYGQGSESSRVLTLFQAGKNPRRLYPALDAKGEASIKPREAGSNGILSRGWGFAQARQLQAK
jgi:hypothetical protein